MKIKCTTSSLPRGSNETDWNDSVNLNQLYNPYFQMRTFALYRWDHYVYLQMMRTVT